VTVGSTSDSIRESLVEQLHNHRNPAWLRVSIWATLNAQHGHARTYPAELRKVLALDRQSYVSRALDQARDRRLIDPCSTTYCVVLLGHALAPCEATHRETP